MIYDRPRRLPRVDRLHWAMNLYALRQAMAGWPDPPVRGLLPFRLTFVDDGVRVQVWGRGLGGVKRSVYAEVVDPSLRQAVGYAWTIWRWRTR